MLKFVLAFVLSGAICMASFAPNDLFNTKWTYNDTYAAKSGLLGPSRWSKSWGMCDTTADGAKQSPINIVHTDVPLSQSGVLPLTFQLNACPTQVRNIGSTLTAFPKDVSTCQATFKTLSNTTYKFSEAHLRWHQQYNHRGTEHRIDGQAEAVEVQLIHFNARFPSLDEAFRDATAGNIAVISVRYTVAPTPANATEVPALDDFIASTYPALRFMDLSKDGVANVGNMNPYDLIGRALPRVNLPMYHYNGSLTVPGCDAITSWYLVQQTAMISQSQMQQLRFFVHVNETTFEKKDLGFDINDNIRPVAPLNGRTVVAWPVIVAPNMSSDSAPETTSSGSTFWTKNHILYISIGGGAGLLLIVAAIILLSVVSKRNKHSGYDSINASA